MQSGCKLYRPYCVPMECPDRRASSNLKRDLSVIIGDRDVGGKSTEVDSVRKIERIPSITRFSSYFRQSNRDLKYRKTALRGFR